jgi:hypothetical protein
VVVVPVAALLIARRAASEGVVWVVVATLLVVVGIVAPSMFALFAMLSAITLALRAYARFWTTVEREQPNAPGPYRMGNETAAGARRYEYVQIPLTAAAKARHLTGALGALYLSLWTVNWHGGGFPAHSIAADVAVLVLAIGLALRLKQWITIAVPTVGGAHAIVLSGIIPTPHTTLGWGSSALVLGFALLLAGLFASYRLRGLTAPET